jgi:hypothetical protein
MRYCYDIETLKRVFTITFLDYDSEQCYQFEISRRINQFQEIKDFYLNKMKWNICFNGIYFDNIVMNWLVDQRFDKKEGEFISSEIYKVAQITINQERDYDLFKHYSKYKYKDYHKVIDLFCYWAKMSRLSKKLSLKTLACSMGMSIEEMPIHHSQEYLTDDEIQLTLEYNKNDCIVTKELANRLKNEINLRMDITKNSGLNVLSYDAPKIASELLLDSYCKKTFTEEISEYTVFEEYKKKIKERRYSTFGFLIKDYIPKFQFNNNQLQNLYNDILKSKSSFEQELLFKNKNGNYIKLQYSNGGLHIVQPVQYFKSNSKFVYVEKDYSSLYPNLYINYNFNSPFFGTDLSDLQNQILKERLDAKKNGRKSEDSTKKLILNSYSGIIDNAYSPFYAPEQALAMRITGQLCISKVIDKYYELRIEIVSVNTDSVTLKLERDNLYLLDKVREEIKSELNLNLEDTFYHSIYYFSVNDYIGFTESGKVKCKGEFIYNHILDGSNEFTIIPLAIKEFLQNNVPISKTVNECKELWRFCKSQKVDKKFKIFYQGKEIQHLNRYFVSDRKNGAYLYKSPDGIKMLNLFKDTPIYICNEDIRESDILKYPINREWYIRKAEEKLQNFFPSQTILF